MVLYMHARSLTHHRLHFILRVLILLLMSLKELTALPRDRATNDVLKIEYLDVNLKNSRRLIGAIGEMHIDSTHITNQVPILIGCLKQVQVLQTQLSWLDNIESKVK